jgi:hypothetical protein
MPLCPQITNTPITVSLTADFTVTNVIPVLPANTEQLAALDAEVVAADAAAAAAVVTANAAAAAAGAAQADATEALADALVAYNAAIGSLQPSANTIVNASNQMTAINSGGITVYSGASASSGARVVLNSAGLAGFNSGGSATFSISASTGAAVFSGSVTGSTITGGTLNIAGNAIINASGLLTATGATITGDIRATAGYFGTATNGFSISSTGLVGVGTGTIVGGAISGTTFTNGSTFSVTSAGVITASSGTIGGTTLGASSLTGGLIQTSSGSASVSLVGANNSLTFKTSSTNVGHILPLSSFGVLTHYGATADPSGGTFPQMFVGSTNVSISASATRSIGVATTGIDLTGPTSLNGTVTYPGVATGAGTTMVVVTTGSRVAIVTSSERFKEQIQYINTTGWLDKVMQMKPITYKTSVDFTTEGEPNETQIGFLAEDIYDIGGDLEKAVVLDPLGEPFSLSYDRLTVFLTLAIKELKAEIDQLKGE